jgi:hypothetical protein
MKTSTFSAILIAMAAAVSSCNSGIDKNNDDAAQQFTPAPTTVLPSVAADSTGTPAGNQPATLAVNPAHGAPGHRCDLPVGAPLSSAAANPGAPAANSPVNITSPVQSGSVVHINPPHGQPGHDCSVEVGKPLP